MKYIFRCIIIICLSVLIGISLSGCSTIHNLEKYEPLIYGGVRYEIPWGCKYFDCESALPIGVVLSFLDLPLSLIADTITLPIVIIYNLTKPQLPRKK